MSGRTEVFLHGIATTVPEHYFTQEFALDFLLKLQGKTFKRRGFLKKIYTGSAIDKRHTVITDYGKDPSAFTFYPKNPELLPEPSTEARNDIFIREAERLALDAATALFGSGTLSPDGVTHLITVSCTGFSAPGFDLTLLKSLPLPPHTHRFHLGFMGCYAAFPALKLARDICRANPGAQVLIVDLELCSLHFQQKFEPDIVVANALFADGAAAALVSADPNLTSGPRLVLEDFRTTCLPDSGQDMAWKIGAHGFDMKLSLYVPRLIESSIRSILEEQLESAGVAREAIDIWAIHPGGRAILDKVAAELDLPPGALDISYAVLREFGNMSSATIFFVLERILAADQSGQIFASAFGPGLTVESALFRKKG